MFFIYNLDFNISNRILQDKTYKKNKFDKEKMSWKERKEQTIEVSNSLKRLHFYNRAERMGECSNLLLYAECEFDNFKKLVRANLCHDRLCPVCNWRKSNLMFNQLKEMIDFMLKNRDMQFVFLTLTVENIKDFNLDKCLDNLFPSLGRFFKYKRISNMSIGYCRTVEVTRNTDKSSKSYGTYHPHVHVLMAVEPDYFTGPNYVKQKEMGELWQRALKVKYNPVVYIKKIQPKDGQDFNDAIAEVVKYCVKPADYLCDTDAETDKVIRTLAYALKGRRLVGYGGLFKEIRKQLKLQDLEDKNVDLVNATKHEKCCPMCGGDLHKVLYGWDYKRTNYYRVNIADDEIDELFGKSIIYKLRQSKKGKKVKKPFWIIRDRSVKKIIHLLTNKVIINTNYYLKCKANTTLRLPSELYLVR